MSYGWFKPLKTIRLDSEFGLQQMAYQVLSDAISSLRSLIWSVELGNPLRTENSPTDNSFFVIRKLLDLNHC